MAEMHPEIAEDIAAALRQAVSDADRPRLEMLLVSHGRHVQIVRATVGDLADATNLEHYAGTVLKLDMLEVEMRLLAGWH